MSAAGDRRYAYDQHQQRDAGGGVEMVAQQWLVLVIGVVTVYVGRKYLAGLVLNKGIGISHAVSRRRRILRDPTARRPPPLIISPHHTIITHSDVPSIVGRSKVPRNLHQQPVDSPTTALANKRCLSRAILFSLASSASREIQSVITQTIYNAPYSFNQRSRNVEKAFSNLK